MKESSWHLVAISRITSKTFRAVDFLRIYWNESLPNIFTYFYRNCDLSAEQGLSSVVPKTNSSIKTVGVGRFPISNETNFGESKRVLSKVDE